MTRAIQLAQRGHPWASPNPSVGCVIVWNNTIIGEGYTSSYGGPHAEINAINAVKDNNVKWGECTFYVTLEPCAHYGKTPPCALQIAELHPYRVVIGCKDPNPLVAGKGIDILEEMGIEVECGILRSKCLHLHRHFLTEKDKKRPYILLKYAKSKDGYMAPRDTLRKDKDPYWLTNWASRQFVHKTRARHMGILVGYNTVIKDEPKLNVRDWFGNDPIRFVLDLKNKLPNSLEIFQTKPKTYRFVYTQFVKNKETELSISKNKPIIPQLVSHLASLGIQSLMVEGGAKTINLFLAFNTWDEIQTFTSSINLGAGLPAPKVERTPKKEHFFKTDRLSWYFND